MFRNPAGSFLTPVMILVLVSSAALAVDHHALNGTWRLIPARSEFGGEPAIQTGTVTIGYRDRNIYISKNFTFDGRNQTVSYQSSTDGRINSSIHEGQAFKTKARWEGDELMVTSTQDNITTVERYRLSPDGTLILTTERPGRATTTVLFERQ